MGWFGRKKASAPDAQSTGYVHSRNMHLKVAAPRAEGWKVMEAGGGGHLLAAFKCLYGDTPGAPDTFALDAMLYGADGASPLPTLTDFEARDWRAHFLGSMFREIRDLETKRVEHRARAGGFIDEGLEVTVEGTLQEPAIDVVFRQRHVPLGERLLVASAAGSKERHEALAQLVDAWLSHAALGER
ncbi:MAG: hypothetical protein R3B72_36795 [Polyangiaceae bacterium]